MAGLDTDAISDRSSDRERSRAGEFCRADCRADISTAVRGHVSACKRRADGGYRRAAVYAGPYAHPVERHAAARALSSMAIFVAGISGRGEKSWPRAAGRRECNVDAQLSVSV